MLLLAYFITPLYAFRLPLIARHMLPRIAAAIMLLSFQAGHAMPLRCRCHFAAATLLLCRRADIRYAKV